MCVTCLEQQSFCHALRKILKFKLFYFQNKECYPGENKQADGNLDYLICDEDKNPKLCLVINFSFSVMVDFLKDNKAFVSLFEGLFNCVPFAINSEIIGKLSVMTFYHLIGV